MSNGENKSLKLLFIGNSFSDDTMEYFPDIAASFGYTDIVAKRLFIGACSVNMHLQNAYEDKAAYLCYTNLGMGWRCEPNVSIKEALLSEKWDCIAFLGGTGDGSRAVDPESYRRLPELVNYARSVAGEGVKTVFNMTWVGEPTHKHPHIVEMGGDVERMYRLIAENMENTVSQMKEIDVISPTGTAIQNARTSSYEGKFTRDGYHLNHSVGRYIAALTFFGAVTGEDVSNVKWFPNRIGEKAEKIAVESAVNALKEPFSVTQSKI